MTSRPSWRLWWWLVSAFWLACNGGGCSSCACLSPIPGGFEGTRLDNSVVVRVSDQGFDFLNANYAAILEQAGITSPMQLPVACGNVSFGSDGHFCDQNRNDRCDPGEQCLVNVDISDFHIAPATAPANEGVLNASLKLAIHTGDMWMRTCGISAFGSCICHLTCSANFSSTRSGSQTDTISVDVHFTLDAQWNRIVAFDVTNIGGISSLESDDLNVNASGGFCSALTCNLLDLGFIKDYVVDQNLKPALLDNIRKSVDKARCRACGANEPPCPTGSSCQANVCKDGAGACVPTQIGVEGRADLTQASLGNGTNVGALDVYAVAGGSVSSQANAHFTLGVMGGGEPVTGSVLRADGGMGPLRDAARCVPQVAAPADVSIPAPDWASFDGGYHVGLAVGSRYLKRLSWGAHQAGAMCLDVSTALQDRFTTGLLAPFLPSLGLLTPDGQDAPMILAVRPKEPPRVAVGEGTYDPTTHAPIKPLLRLQWTEVNLDMYALIEDRYLRLFTIVTDIDLPLSLVVDGCESITPVLGNVKDLLTNVRAINSEVLAEDPQVVADLIPTLLAAAESSLSGGLGPQALPNLAGYQLQVNDVKGITPIAGTETYEHLALFAQLALPDAGCAPRSITPRALLKRTEMPPREKLIATGQGLPWPVAVLDLSGDPSGLEYAWRVDQGLWSGFQPAQGELRISHPGFLLQGLHHVEVRTRLAEAPLAVSEPVTVDFTVDFEPPRVTLRFTADGQVVLIARDQVTPLERLTWSVQLGSGEPSAWGPKPELDLATLNAAGGVTVRVRDEAGLVGEASYRGPTVALRPDAVSDTLGKSAMGCSAVGASPFAVAALAWCLARARRRRAR